MEEAEKKALVVYLAVCAIVGWLGHTNLAVPHQKRRIALQREVKDLAKRQAAFKEAKTKFDLESQNLEAIRQDLRKLLDQFPAPRERRGIKEEKIYDEFAISEQISSAARGLVLAPKQGKAHREFEFQSRVLEEENMNTLGDDFQNPRDKAAVPPELALLGNVLSVSEPRFSYTVSGNYGDFLKFLVTLGQQKLFLDVTEVDLYQKGASGTRISARVTVSTLDLSDGLAEPPPQ